ncbi:MAG: transketolase [Bilifractor sp.]|jgi:transketolase
MADKRITAELRLQAARCRKNVLRMIRAGGHGHIGGALSAIDIVTALYFYKMNADAKNPRDENRDRFLLSAGHKCLAQYAVLAEKGYFDKAVLDTYGELSSRIPGHPNMHYLPGIEANTGALGHGMSIAAGMAMAAKLDHSDYSVYVVTGDGELPEGSNWEAAAAAAKFGLDNLVVFVDNNGLQISGDVTDVMNMEPIDQKFAAFGWAVKTIDGNNMEEICDVLDELPLQKGKPTMILAKTVKAKGLSFGEGKAEFHFWNATRDLLDRAESEFDARIAALERERRDIDGRGTD